METVVKETRRRLDCGLLKVQLGELRDTQSWPGKCEKKNNLDKR